MASKESLIPDYHSYYDQIQPVLDPSKLDLTIIPKINGSSKTWPTFPCSLWFETNAKVNVSCVNCHDCKFKKEREWHGRIVGNGIHGFLNALFVKVKHRASKKRPPLMGLLTVCLKCRGEPDLFYDADQLDQIVKKTSGRLILGLSEKEVEEVISSKEVIMEGLLMDSIKTVGIDGREKEWCMLRPLFSI